MENDLRWFHAISTTPHAHQNFIEAYFILHTDLVWLYVHVTSEISTETFVVFMLCAVCCFVDFSWRSLCTFSRFWRFGLFSLHLLQSFLRFVIYSFLFFAFVDFLVFLLLLAFLLFSILCNHNRIAICFCCCFCFAFPVFRKRYMHIYAGKSELWISHSQLFEVL